MMRWIVGSSLQYRPLVVALAVALVFFGSAQLSKMPVDVLPEFAPPYVEVQTEALGLSAHEVEMLISMNLEELLNGVPWLTTIRSKSVPGLSQLTLIFEPGTDIFRARQVIQERLLLAHMLPNVSKPPVVIQPLSATSRIMMIGMSSKDVSPVQMGVLAHWVVKPALMGVPGVANVAVWGQRDRQLQVQVDPERLRAYGVTLDQIITTAGDSLWVSPLSFVKASTPGTGGWFDAPQQRLEVRHISPISTAEDLAKVTIEGTPLKLAEVAQVVENHQPLIGDAALKSGPGLLLVIEKFPGANTLDVTRALDAKLDTLRLGLPGVELDSTVFRPASYIQLASSNLTQALLVGSVLAVLALGAFLFRWRTALVALVVIPLSLLAAVYVLYLRGGTMAIGSATFNVMVLAGLLIALVAVVDDAVIDVDNIARRLRQHRRAGSGKSTAAVVLEAAAEARGTVGFATLMTLLFALPILVMQGLTGAFFQPLAVSYVLALLASMVVALSVTPALCLMLLSGKALDRGESPLVSSLQRGYTQILSRILRTPHLAYLTLGAFAVAGLAAWPLLGHSLLPEFREPALKVRWEAAPGTSLPEMYRLVAQAGNELRAIPGVSNFGAHVGRAVTGDQVVGVHSAELWVSIDPKANYDATVAAVRNTIAGYPGVAREVQTYLQDRISQVVTGTGDDVVVRIFGPEFPVLRQKAAEVRQALQSINGVADLRIESQVEQPYVEIEVNLAKAEQHGIKPGDVRRAASTLVNGITVGNLFEGQKVFDVVVWSTPQTRQHLTSLRELLIDKPGGGHVRLQDVADVRLAPTLETINRESVSRRIDVSFNIRGRDAGAVVNEVQNRLRQVQFPLEYHPELLGVYAEQQAAQQRVLGAAVAAVIGIFLLLQAAFQSWRLATLAFFTLPVAVAGGVLAALASGGSLALGSLIGFLAILAIAARNGVMQISHYQRLQREEGEPFGAGLVLRGAQERVAPTLLTALVTGLALVPLAVAGNQPGFEVVQPLAIVILGGLVTSTLLSLFVVPALYLRFAPAGPTPVVHTGWARFPGARPSPQEASKAPASVLSTPSSSASSQPGPGLAPDGASSTDGRTTQNPGGPHNGAER
jgi:CzcA family heavy metal efflux pump